MRRLAEKKRSFGVKIFWNIFPEKSEKEKKK